MSVHHFASTLLWTGTNAQDGAASARDLRIELEGRPPILASGAVPFGGDGARHNPEELLLAALSSCHALSFLAIAARARIIVRAYEDDASAVLSKVGTTYAITEATLRPRVVFAPGTDLARAEQLQSTAHANCFIARSIAFPVKIEPVHSLAAN